MLSRAIRVRGILVGLMIFGGLVTAISQEPTPSGNTTIGASGTSKPTLPLVTRGNTATDVSQDNATQASMRHGNPLWSIPLATLIATRERPIFSASRRPPPRVASVAPTQAPPSVQPMLALLGAIAGETDGIAIFLDGTTKDTIRLKTGETHAGWTLQAVKAREVIMQNEQKTAVLMLPLPATK